MNKGRGFSHELGLLFSFLECAIKSTICHGSRSSRARPITALLARQLNASRAETIRSPSRPSPDRAAVLLCRERKIISYQGTFHLAEPSFGSRSARGDARWTDRRRFQIHRAVSNGDLIAAPSRRKPLEQLLASEPQSGGLSGLAGAGARVSLRIQWGAPNRTGIRSAGASVALCVSRAQPGLNDLRLTWATRADCIALATGEPLSEQSASVRPLRKTMAARLLVAGGQGGDASERSQAHRPSS